MTSLPTPDGVDRQPRPPEGQEQPMLLLRLLTLLAVLAGDALSSARFLLG